MNKMILRADGRVERGVDVGDGYESWNKAIDARCGTIVQGQIVDTNAGRMRDVELWCDDEALCVAEPVQNFYASLLARQPIFGDVIVFAPGDIK